MGPVALALALAVGTAPVTPVSRADLGRSWHPGCPVSPTQLRLVRIRYRGFDGAAHLGGVVVNVRVVGDVRRVFARLYAQRFPIRRIRPISEYGGSDEASMAADNTSGFNCRYAVAPGPRRWSSHAYGLAIDVNPVENPYLDRGVVRPRAGRRYLDRGSVRPGMAVAAGPVVRAFAAVGWSWGGRWSAPDYQHFSATGH
jgi:hypothetical protein